MQTFSMGFYFNQGKKVGYDIDFPNGVGGSILLSNVSAKDKTRIVKEIKACGHSTDEIAIEKRTS